MGKIFANHISDKSPVSRIFKELLQLNNKKTNDPIKKVVKGLEQEFLQREYINMHKQMKKCFISLVLKEMQTKTTMR